MKTGVELVAIERTRQIEKLGYDLENDLNQDNNQLIREAMNYIGIENYEMEYLAGMRIDNLIKAGALICAEIDKLSYERDLSNEP